MKLAIDAAGIVPSRGRRKEPGQLNRFTFVGGSTLTDGFVDVVQNFVLPGRIIDLDALTGNAGEFISGSPAWLSKAIAGMCDSAQTGLPPDAQVEVMSDRQGSRSRRRSTERRRLAAWCIGRARSTQCVDRYARDLWALSRLVRSLNFRTIASGISPWWAAHGREEPPSGPSRRSAQHRFADIHHA
jgi:hypothetical protein